MSVKAEQNKEEKVVEVVETTDLEVANKEAKEAKKAKIKGGIIKGLKIAGVALVGGIVGFICGKKSGESTEYYEEVESVESDVE